MKLLLTGARGFIGSALCDSLDNCKSVKVFKVVRGNVQRSNDDIFYIDDLFTADWNSVLSSRDFDCVVHLAALAHSQNIDSDKLFQTNTQATIRLAKKAAEFGVSRFVFVSSIGVNGTSTDLIPFADNSIPSPHNEYAQSKYEAELGLKKISDETGLEVVIVRPTLVYGPNAPGNFGLLTKLVKQLPVLPFGLATNKRDFIAVQNLADLLVTCAVHPNAAGQTFLASDMETISIKDFTNCIAEGLGKKVIQLPIPVTLMRFLGRLTGKSVVIEQLFGNLQVNSSNLKEKLDWIPPYTMQQAMARLLNSGNN
ncbi:NAD-dependent epimerase/dehydratase family protein [Shewanella sp. YIC-542]|uniref:NAD-dependent epimerase/dehydratase family protein n=1 Tax=Shewanella mytili TaxID=3377111 RepID=UPI00398E67D7